MSFTVVEFTFAYLWLFAAVLRLGWTNGIAHNSETNGTIRLRRMSPGSGFSACLVPAQPEDGKWQLHQRFCDPGQNCDIPQGLVIQVGSHLVYSCDYDFNLEGNENVYCTTNGVWSDIPNCIKKKCKSLNSVSRMMLYDYYNETTVALEGDVERFDKVRLACRPGYRKDTVAFPLSQGEINYCLEDATWQLEPMACIADCGITPTPQVIGEADANISNLPWHASLYLSNGTHKNFICGATIIRPNFLLTAALCVVNKSSHSLSIDDEKLFVMTGNTIIDYDSPLHNPDVVKKAAVSNVIMDCVFDGSVRYVPTDYATDLALLLLKEPLLPSHTLVPACLDFADDSEELLQPGVYGRSAGVVRTVTGASSGILRTLTLPFLSGPQYYSASANEFEDQVPISKDKFTAGSTKGSGICGSGLVFKKNNRWQVMGILSTGYKNVPNENGEKICNRLSNSRWTWIAPHLEWIFDNFNPPGLCERIAEGCLRVYCNPLTSSAYRPPPPVILTKSDISCPAPPQPKNGEWLFHGHPCWDDMGCKIPQVTELKPGSLLVYSCASGYRASGNTDVFCRSTGKWSPIPDCIPVNCDPLNSISTVASCTRFREFVSCDSPVPAETQAVVSCRDGYRKDSVFVATRREIVTCTERGKWQPDPIRCVPVCGVAINPQVPFAIDGVPAKVSDFPWHATLYIETTSSRGTSKDFQCGATIIQANFLLTAAHCVYDERTKTTVDPKKLFVMTGNIFRDWDFTGHDLRVVRKAQVKNVYKHSKYYGFTGNYVSDIALLELQKPFNFSGILLPACLDVEENSGRILQAGALGKVAGFGRTALGPSSAILQTVTAPYIPETQCKSSKNAVENEYLISNDKFCAGYNNGTAVCDGDSGGGLVFRKNDLWYIMGIVSVGIGVDLNNGERTCDRYSYTLYTKVTTYMPWIQDVISNSEQYQS